MRKLLIIICICLFALSSCGRVSSESLNQLHTSHQIQSPDNNLQSEEGNVNDEEIETITNEKAQDTNKERIDTPTQNSNRTESKNAPEITGHGKEEGSDAKINSPLSQKIICIDAGHGNPEIPIGNERIAPESEETVFGGAFGAQGVVTGIPEYVINMEVSLKLKDALEEQGCSVVLTRQSNEENLSNVDRALIGNKAEADLVIRVHADGSENKTVNGVSVLFPGGKYIKDEVLLESSKEAAQYVHDAVVEATGAKPRGIVKRNDLIGFNWSTRPTILIEMGFLSNPEEDVLLNEWDYQNKIVEGIVKGLIEYFSGI